MSSVEEFDAIIIGAGSGGLTVAVSLTNLGKSVCLVEAKDVGGDCTNVGCIPSKSLLHHSKEADASQALSKVRTARDTLRDEETEHFANLDNLTLEFGKARVMGKGLVEITNANAVQAVKAKHIVIATGSKPRRTSIPGLPSHKYLTNEELFEMTEAPSKLAIVGGGAIGVEMATAFSQLGTQVVLIEAANHIMPNLLPEAAAVVTESLKEQGVEIATGVAAKEYDEEAAKLKLGPLDGQITESVDAVDKVLVAVGRVANTKHLGLDAAGVKIDAQDRIVIDRKGRTSAKRIWAVGDATTRGGTTHLANAWGRKVAKGIFPLPLPSGPMPVDVNVAYSEPEVATIGHQPELVANDVRRITYDYTETDRAYTDEVRHGIIIVDIRKFSGKILGATIVGPRAGELISTFSLAMRAGLKIQKWYDTVWPYPTYSTALGKVVDLYMIAHIRNVHKDFFSWVKGRLKLN